MPTIQSPFTDAGQIWPRRTDSWSPEEVELLLRGVAANHSWERISKDISEELADRSPKACKMQWERVREQVRTAVG